MSGTTMTKRRPASRLRPRATVELNEALPGRSIQKMDGGDGAELTKLVHAADIDSAKIPAELIERRSAQPAFIKELIEARAMLGMMQILDRLTLYNALQCAAVAANLLITSDDAWGKFCAAGLVSKPLGNGDRKKALRWAVEASTGVTDSKRLSDYVRALTYLLQTKTAPTAIAVALTHGGYTNVLRLSRQEARTKAVGGVRKAVEGGQKKRDRGKAGSTSYPAILTFEEGVLALAQVAVGRKIRLTGRVVSVGARSEIRVTQMKELKKK